MKPLSLVTLVALAALVITGSSAAATERRLADDRDPILMSSSDSWLSWVKTETVRGASVQVRVIWHQGREFRFPGSPMRATLGVDAAGREVAVFTQCRRVGRGLRQHDCAVIERSLRTRTSTVLMRAATGSRIWLAVDEGGSFVFGGDGVGRSGLGLFSWAGTGSRLKKIGPGFPQWIQARNGRALYIAQPRAGDEDSAIRLVDLHSARIRLLVTHRDVLSCRCTDSATVVTSPALDSHYAYWVVQTYYPTSDQEPTSVLERVDLDTHNAPVEVFTPEHQFATALVVSNGRLFYGAYSGGVYEVDRPIWQRTREHVPVDE